MVNTHRIRKGTVYFVVNHRVDGIDTGVYSVDNNFHSPEARKLTSIADKVWLQGPKGGVRIIKDRSWLYPIGYVTTNEKYMKEFSWVKLSAKQIS